MTTNSRIATATDLGLRSRIPREASSWANTVYRSLAKAIIDRTLGLLILLLALPLLLLTALVVASTLGAPLMYRQRRVGKDGEVFEMLKFRTMLPDRRAARSGDHSAEDRRLTHKTLADPRHTRIGLFLRKYSLDELPQLIHVVTGRLSLVGPRPELASVVEREYAPWQHERHTVKPGLTGLWQVSERNENGVMHECVDTDLRYIQQLSLRTDFSIIVRTVPVLLGVGAR